MHYYKVLNIITPKRFFNFWKKPRLYLKGVHKLLDLSRTAANSSQQAMTAWLFRLCITFALKF